MTTITSRILIVDDEPSALKVTTKILQRLGYHVIGHSDPKRALEILGAFPDQFDLLITDYRMPAMNGDRLFELARDINPRLPVILCSGYCSEFDRAGAERLGFDKFVRKPLLKDDFAALVKNVLQERK